MGVFMQIGTVGSHLTQSDTDRNPGEDMERRIYMQRIFQNTTSPTGQQQSFLPVQRRSARDTNALSVGNHESQPEIDHLKPMLNHHVDPVHSQRVPHAHQLLRLPLVHQLQHLSRRRRVPPHPFLLHARHQLHRHHLLPARGRGYARHEEREHDKAEVEPARMHDALRHLEDDRRVVPDVLVGRIPGLQALPGPHARVGEDQACVEQGQRLELPR